MMRQAHRRSNRREFVPSSSIGSNFITPRAQIVDRIEPRGAQPLDEVIKISAVINQKNHAFVIEDRRQQRRTIPRIGDNRRCSALRDCGEQGMVGSVEIAKLVQPRPLRQQGDEEQNGDNT